ncbi:MAG: hypothetical protein QM744_10240 [Mesorhizobium sp.]
MGTVYAVDNRGFDRAVQIDTPAGSFRKVIPVSLDLKQNDKVGFRLPAEASFLFDTSSGQRISQMGEGR